MINKIDKHLTRMVTLKKGQKNEETPLKILQTLQE